MEKQIKSINSKGNKIVKIQSDFSDCILFRP